MPRPAGQSGAPCRKEAWKGASTGARWKIAIHLWVHRFIVWPWASSIRHWTKSETSRSPLMMSAKTRDRVIVTLRASSTWSMLWCGKPDHYSFRDPQEHLRTPNCEGNTGPHCTRDIPAGPLRAGGPGVLIPKKSWCISHPTWTEGTCTAWLLSMALLWEHAGPLRWAGQATWMVLQFAGHCLLWPPLLVSVFRIRKKEEIDQCVSDQKKQTSLVNPQRPKNCKEKMVAILDGTMNTRIGATQADRKDSNKMWFLYHPEIIRKYVLDNPSLPKSW